MIVQVEVTGTRTALDLQIRVGRRDLGWRDAFHLGTVAFTIGAKFPFQTRGVVVGTLLASSPWKNPRGGSTHQPLWIRPLGLWPHSFLLKAGAMLGFFLPSFHLLGLQNAPTPFLCPGAASCQPSPQRSDLQVLDSCGICMDTHTVPFHAIVVFLWVWACVTAHPSPTECLLHARQEAVAGLSTAPLPSGVRTAAPNPSPTYNLASSPNQSSASPAHLPKSCA